MSDLKKYIDRRKQTDQEFSSEFDEGYKAFKIGAVLKQAREASGLTQEQIATKLGILH
jgi:ribosome-binding protein aMBF1 (putative translation factor)